MTAPPLFSKCFQNAFESVFEFFFEEYSEAFSGEYSEVFFEAFFGEYFEAFCFFNLQRLPAVSVGKFSALLQGVRLVYGDGLVIAGEDVIHEVFVR